MLFLDEKLIVLQSIVEKFWDKPWQDEFTAIMRRNSVKIEHDLRLFRGLTHEDCEQVGYDIADGHTFQFSTPTSFSGNIKIANDFAGMWCYETNTVHALNAYGARACNLGKLAIDILMTADEELKKILLSRRPAHKGWDSWLKEKLDMLTNEDEWIILPDQVYRAKSTLVEEELSSNVIIFSEIVYNDDEVC
ncbi:hypothetical protein PS2_020 [Serratia phage PS2]|uniref:Uncharacterized protein n=1 Tax=Serratia phage PS2 TaxID=1481112 RepID=A0A023W624_9CAUD|nr:hypothetical protein FF83_gp020 [Serratia phage PS2]AHY25271.1 hypothetical protein PS2_020 [Serratia phage PS2]